ncbi:MAG: site-specific integrase [Planctomycetota bacterium]
MGERKERLRELAFTKRAIEALEPPDEGRVYHYDAKQENLAVCVAAGGSRIFYRCGRVDGRPARIKLGRFPDMSVEQARKAARGVAGDAARGVDPRRKKKRGTTLEALFQHWLARAKRHKKTWADDVRQFNRYFGTLASERLVDITTADVSKWHAKLGDDCGPYQANRCRALLSAMFNVAHELGHEAPNPCQHVKRFREESRERFLLPDEMRPFFQALKEEPPDWRDFWLLCLFSGARRGNVAAMAWEAVDLAQGVWYVTGSQMKNKMPIVIVLPPPAVAILQTRAEQRNGNPWVFPADTASGHIVDPRKSWLRVLKNSGIGNLRPHDLRRSLASWQAVAGTSLQIIGASLGHRDVKSTQVYARLQLDPVKTSVNGAVKAMLEAANGEEEIHAQ